MIQTANQLKFATSSPKQITLYVQKAKMHGSNGIAAKQMVTSSLNQAGLLSNHSNVAEYAYKWLRLGKTDLHNGACQWDGKYPVHTY